MSGRVKGDAASRKAQPIFSGVLRYFPDALLAVAAVSKKGNDQHNPGEPLHWAKEKSRDEGDALLRHLVDVGTVDDDGVRHAAKVAWRALALLQREIEEEQGYGYDEANDRWRILREPIVVTAVGVPNPAHDGCPFCSPTPLEEPPSPRLLDDPADLQAVRADIAELHKRIALGGGK